MLRYEVGKVWQIIQLHYIKWLGLKGRFKREYESVISKVYSRCALEVNLRISAYLLRISLVLVDGIRYVDLVVKKHYEVTLGTTYKVNGHYRLENNRLHLI